MQLLNTRVGYCLVDEAKVNGVLTNCLQCGDIEDKEHWVNKVHKVHGAVMVALLSEVDKKREPLRLSLTVCNL
ncbi:hypothetical protein LRP52_30825 [Photobacterium sp. ZSDE20]|nr:hypothetical protein [Photobacterium sp. ZSDE20]